ncbi:MAG: cytochrome c [Fuerstiella sp.]
MNSASRSEVVLKSDVRDLLSKLVVFLVVCSTASAVEKDVPFIAGWDRFGQHKEISSQLASTLLISELGCAACHASRDSAYQPKAGPKLDDVGTRLQRDWIRNYLMDPSAHRAGTTMPDVLAGESAEQKAKKVEALTAYLMAQKRRLKEIKGSGANPIPLEFWKHGNFSRGRLLFHRSGCVACHAADESFEVGEMKLSDADRRLNQLDPEDIAELGLEAAARRVNSVPHPVLHRKYTMKSLTWFLMNPEAVRPSGRMPNPGLRAVDAADLAAWLMKRPDTSEIAEPEAIALADSALVRQGAVLFQQSGCANCHTSSSRRPIGRQSLQTVAAIWNSNRQRPSCVSNPSARMPDYRLNSGQSQQLSTALKSLHLRLDSRQSLQLTMLQLNCYACHQRDELGGIGRYRKAYFETVGQIDIGDEGRLPPPLTKVGARLQSKWLKDVLKGKSVLRNFMTIRMPEYPDAVVKNLPSQFATFDHPQPFPKERQVFPNTVGLEDAGRKLMDAGCVQCHVFNGESLPGTVGVDLSGVTDRVHADWLKAFLLNPGSMKKGTRMPTFFSGGKSQNRAILNGDTQKQIAAIYAYLKQGDDQPLPQKIADVRDQDFELRPTDRPIVFRTFMPIAGTHAIAVGYPNQVHVAFDAENLFLAEAWRGRFLDAQGTWYVRSAPPAVPLGRDSVVLPVGPTFAMLANVTAAWPRKLLARDGRFDGYSLNPAGVPLLKYHIGSAAFTDQCDPADDGSLVRTLTVSNATVAENLSRPQATVRKELWLKAHEGRRLERVGPGEFISETGLKIQVLGLDVSKGQLVRQGATTRWLLPVEMKSRQPITIRYRW